MYASPAMTERQTVLHSTRAAVRAACLIMIAAIAVGCASTSAHRSQSGPSEVVRVDDRAAASPAPQAVAANDRGLRALESHDLERAVREFQTALDADPGYVAARNNLGRAYSEQRRWRDAAAAFDEAARRDPSSPTPRANLGWVMENAGRLDEAIRHYQTAAALAPDDAEIIANLARARRSRGDRDPSMLSLLDQVALDARPEWSEWANRERARLRSTTTTPTTGPTAREPS